MRYAIGSVSKQFTASAILPLAEEGKLSLDDKVAKWLPELRRAGERLSELPGASARRLTSGEWTLEFVLPPGSPPSGLSWSPDGKTIAFAQVVALH